MELNQEKVSRQVLKHFFSFLGGWHPKYFNTIAENLRIKLPGSIHSVLQANDLFSPAVDSLAYVLAISSSNFSYFWLAALSLADFRPIECRFPIIIRKGAFFWRSTRAEFESSLNWRFWVGMVVTVAMTCTALFYPLTKKLPNPLKTPGRPKLYSDIFSVIVGRFQ